MAADSGQALDVARVSVQKVETAIPATKNIIRREKKHKNLASVGSTQVKIPFFTNAFPLQSRWNGGVNPALPPQILSVIEAKPVNSKDLLFLLAPQIFWSSYGPVSTVCPYYFWKLLYMYTRAGGTRGWTIAPLTPPDFDRFRCKTCSIVWFSIITARLPPDLQTFRLACTCS